MTTKIFVSQIDTTNPDGSAAPQGSYIVIGASGPMWDNGMPSGYQGSAGGTGYTGSIGGVGPIGPAGYQGSVGFFGSRGIDGISGAAGFKGSAGYQGSAGIGGTGYTGSVGYIGSGGYAGSIGFYGSVGFMGSQGIQGIPGYAGSLAGFQGSAGDVGYTGSVGDVGNFGPTGFQGSEGYTGSGGAGYTGSAGYDGSVGYYGSVGYSGSGGAGFTGSAGYNGSVGFIGSVGFFGSVGYLGSVGYAGSAGNVSFENLLGVPSPMQANTFMKVNNTANGVMYDGNTYLTNNISVDVNFNNNKLISPQFKGYSETLKALGTVSTPITISMSDGNVQSLTLPGSSITVVNLSATGTAAGRAHSVTLFITQGAGGGATIDWSNNTVAWPTAEGISAPAGPTLSTTAGVTDIITLYTLDGGSTWYGVLAGAGYV